VVVVGATTVKVIGALFNPNRATVILVVPSALLVAIPSEDIVATLVLELVQVTGEVISETMPFEKVPTATNLWIEPTVKFPGMPVISQWEDNVATGNFAAGLVIRTWLP